MASRITLILWMLIPGVLWAQGFILSGTVTDEDTGAPIRDVFIYNQSEGREVATDAEGRFEFTALDSGLHELILYNDDYRIQHHKVTLSADEKVVIQLSKNLVLTEVVVQAKRRAYFDLKRLKDVEGMSIFAGKKSEVVLVDQIVGNKSNGNARQIYAQVAGLNIYESTNCGLQLAIGGRGLDPNRTANFNTRQNGYDISADVLGYPESYYTPPAEALEQIQIVRGAASLQYGTQFGGLINFKTRRPSRSLLEVVSRQSFDSNCGFSSFNSISGTKGKLSHYSYVNYKNNFDQAPRPNMELESINVFSNINYEISDRSILSLDVTHLQYLAQQPGGLTDRQFYDQPELSNRERNWFKVNWNLVNLRYAHHWAEDSKLEISAWGMASSRYAIGFRTNRVSQLDDPEHPEPRDLQKGDFRNWGAEARYLKSFDMGERKSTLLVGGKYYQAANAERQAPGSRGSDANFEFVAYELDELPVELRQSDFEFPNVNLALFGEQIFYLSDIVSVTPGVRFEYIKTGSDGSFRSLNRDLAGNVLLDTTFEDNRTRERSIALLGLGLSIRPKDDVEVYANVSQNYRSVTFTDIRIINPNFQIDPDIGDERGFTADLGLRGRVGTQLSFDANIYGLLYDDRIDEVLRPETRVNALGEEVETGRVVRFRGNIGRAWIAGVESLADWNIKETWLKRHDHLKMNYYVNLALTQSEFIKSEIAGVEGNELPFVPNINLRSGLKLGYKDVLADLQVSYLGAQFTDASNAPQDASDHVSGIRGAIPAYTVWDFSLAFRRKKWRVEAGVNNLFDKQYFTQRATGYPGPGIIPALPRSVYVTLQYRYVKG